VSKWREPPEGHVSWAAWLAAQHPEARTEFLGSLSTQEQAAFNYDWGFWARRAQIAPSGNWRYWMPLAGRGWGKTRVGAEWVRDLVERGVPKKFGIALVGATVDDARDVLVEGESGLLNISPPWFKPEWIPSKRMLVWPNGEWARTYSGERPDRLRGKQHAYAWADELAAWRYQETWDQLMLGLRLGSNPQCVITTTPRPTELIKALAKDPHTVLTRGSTYENAANLAQAFIDIIIKKYEGTRLGLQELYAKILDDNPAALWKRAIIDALRDKRRTAADVARECRRIVVAIDPAVTSDETSDETGIIVAGVGEDGHGYVLEDCSGKYTPAEWARVAVWKFTEWQADRIIAEVNNGGDLVETTIRAVEGRHQVAYSSVHASRGKVARAEPVAALYEQGRVHHVGSFGALEDQLCDWDPMTAKKSPDRLDALVWAMSALMLGEGQTKRGNLPPGLAAMVG